MGGGAIGNKHVTKFSSYEERFKKELVRNILTISSYVIHRLLARGSIAIVSKFQISRFYRKYSLKSGDDPQLTKENSQAA